MAHPPSADPDEHRKILSTLTEEIWKRAPVLADIMQKRGDKTLRDYSEDFLDVNPSPALDARKEEFVTLLGELVAGRLSPEVGEGVAKQLRKLAFVSTADHHAPIDNAYWVNSDIITALPYDKHPDLQYLVVLSFASVSLNNSSGFPRGIEFHGNTRDSASYVRLPILPDKLKMSIVYGTRSFNREDLDKAIAELQKKEQAGEVEPERAVAVRRFLEEEFARPPVLQAAHLCSQITRINYHLWPTLFHDAHGKRSHVPDLITFDIETLVTQLLLRHHLQNKNSLIHRVLFNPAFEPLIRKHFDGIPGAFSASEKWGTYLFWGVDEKLRRVTADHQGNELVCADASLNIPWTPDGLASALKSKRIFPGMLLCYLVVALYYGIKCLGGFCQVNDLTETKRRWQLILHELGEETEEHAIDPVQTKELNAGGMFLAYLTSPTGDLIPATGVDMVIDQSLDTSMEHYQSLARSICLTESMDPVLPSAYSVFYSSPERRPELLEMTPEAIMEKTGLKSKFIL